MSTTRWCGSTGGAWCRRWHWGRFWRRRGRCCVRRGLASLGTYLVVDHKAEAGSGWRDALEGLFTAVWVVFGLDYLIRIGLALTETMPWK